MSAALDERRNSITGSLFFLSGRRSGVSEAGWQERLAPVRCELQFVYLFAEVGFSGASEQTKCRCRICLSASMQGRVPLTAVGGLVLSWFRCGVFDRRLPERTALSRLEEWCASAARASINRACRGKTVCKNASKHHYSNAEFCKNGPLLKRIYGI